MKQYSSAFETHSQIENLKNKGVKIGFVPTMGALHDGHLSLVERCKRENDVCVVSIFVNPTQFNNPDDLKKYPRTLESDLEMLSKHLTDNDIVFTPTESEMYPDEKSKKFELDFGMLDKVMEGKFRPGHFNGVALIVKRLFDTTLPDNAYFGEKDFQQLAVVRQLVHLLSIPVIIHGCPIVRESDGLAMSSRNMRLTAEHRKVAPLIYKTLLQSAKMLQNKSAVEVEQWVVNQINAEPLLTVEYFEIVNSLTLLPVNSKNENTPQVGCIAVFAGDIRLIDNILYS